MEFYFSIVEIFLVVVILIILVVVTGLKIKHAADKLEAPTPLPVVDLAPLEAEVKSLKGDVLVIWDCETQSPNLKSRIEKFLGPVR